MENTSSRVLWIEPVALYGNGLLFGGSSIVHKWMNPNSCAILNIGVGPIGGFHLDKFGIEDIKNVDFTLEIKSNDGTEFIESIPINISFSDEKASFNTSGKELYNENGVRIISKGFALDSKTFDVLLFVENTSSEDIFIKKNNKSIFINGNEYTYVFTELQIPAQTYSSVFFMIVDNKLKPDAVEGKEIKAIHAQALCGIALSIQVTEKI